MRWITWTVSVAMAVLSFGVVMVQAQDGSAPMAPGPRLIHFSGVLLEAVGRPVKGVQGVNFAIYKEQQGGPALWIETQNVIADEQGLFAVLLGAGTGTGVPLELFTAGESRWLGIQAVGQEEQPRVLLVSVPYAIKAVDAERLGGLPVSAFARADVVTNAAASLASSVSDKGTAPISQAITTQTINAGYIPKFASDIGDLGNSIISESGGKIGVGTTTPKEKFQIGNRWSFSDGGHKLMGYNFYFGGTPSADRRILGGPADLMRFTDTGEVGFQVAASDVADSVINWKTPLYLNVSGKVGVNTTTPREAFQIGDRWTFHNGGSKTIGYNFYFGGTPSADRRILDGPSAVMRFTSTGDIGFQVGGTMDEVVTDRRRRQ